MQLTIVMPFFNELGAAGALIERTHRALSGVVQGEKPLAYELLFVNNGSNPEQVSGLKALAAGDARVRVLSLSRNFGYQGALWAGLDHAKGQAVAFMDGDGEDPPEVLAEFVRVWLGGKAEVVYGVRKSRKTSALLSVLYKLFYRMLARWSSVPIPLDAGEFSLISGPALRAVRQINDRTRMLRILRAWVGYRQVAVAYHREARIEGQSKFNLFSAFAFAWDGFVAATDIPVRMAIYFALGCLGVGGFGLIYYLLWYFFSQEKIPGFASLNITILFLFSALFACIAVIARYIITLLEETRKRPPYLVMDDEK